jgi:hypothetical protein
VIPVKEKLVYAELKEVIFYKLKLDDPERKELINSK